MGSYSELYLERFYLGGDKDGINPLVMTLFRESDKRVIETDMRDPRTERYFDPRFSDEDDPITVVQYACSTSTARDRLELMGFTFATSVEAFGIALADRIAEYEESSRTLGGDLFHDPLAVLRSLTVEAWLEGLLEIRARNLKPTYRSDPACDEYSPLLRFMLCTHGAEWYGYPGYDIRHVIRLALEALDEDAELAYDLTELVAGDYYHSADDLTLYAAQSLAEDFPYSQPVVVLTEGSSDKWILQRSLNLLLPHLSEYFTFMDFEGVRLAGGAGALVQLVKAFAGAGILNRIVAVFDNDTAARAALSSLDQVELPAHIVAIQYPSLRLAERYPTLGPSGVAEMDVNGLAGSIELYLGEDVLTDENGDLAPVQWRGYDNNVKQYQGEVLNKRELHVKFEKKLQACEEDNCRLPDYDWEGVRLILDSIRSAFVEVDSADLLEAV